MYIQTYNRELDNRLKLLESVVTEFYHRVYKSIENSFSKIKYFDMNSTGVAIKNLKATSIPKLFT